MFVEKLNKKQDGVYSIEEMKEVDGGVWEGTLDHDNVVIKSISIYTAPKFGGTRVTNFLTSSPGEMPWKTFIKVFSDSPNIYIVYDCLGDQVEAEDINLIQETLVSEIERSKIEDLRLDTAIKDEAVRAESVESGLRTDLSAEVIRAKAEEVRLDGVVTAEITRATNKDNILDTKINTETIRATNKENQINTDLNSEINRSTSKDNDLQIKKADVTYVDIELNKRYLKTQTFTKEEVLQKIQDVIGAAPDALDTLVEIANALNNDPNFAATLTMELAKKVDKITGKALSDENYTLAEKNKLAGVEVGANKYVHPTGTNPHGTTKADVGLGNVENTSNANMPVSIAQQTALNLKADKTQVLTNVPANAKFTDTVYTHPVTDGSLHVPATGTTNNGKVLTAGPTAGSLSWQPDVDTITTINGKTGAIAKADIVALGIPAQDTVYTHPTTHPPTIIAETTTKRFVTDVEKANWNGKSDKTYVDATFATKVEIGQAGYGDMLKSVYDTNNDGKVDKAALADAVPWAGVSNKPSTFAPSGHNHSIANITSLQTTLDEKETPSGAQAKATAALNSAKSYAMNAINAGATNVDPNTTQESYILTNHANSPGLGLYWHIQTYFYNSKVSNRAQLAISYNSGYARMFIRSYFNSWNSWTEVTTKSSPLTCNDLKGV